jgi:PAS domain S-box-containing protein
LLNDQRGLNLNISPRIAVDEAQLARAITIGAIYPVFQPIVRLPSGSISGFEVLARWTDDKMGSIPPTTFIPIAEKTGLMTALTSHVIRSACASASLWDGEFRLAFNISPLQFQDAELPSRIEEAVRPSGFALSRIQLEITESAIIDDLNSALISIGCLKRLGVQIVLDDFGTGYSSLTRLQALPFDKIKVDASFVRSMGTSRDSRKIVGAVIGLGQSLGMPVVAEGVETQAQSQMLVQLGCDFGQGYLFSRPVPADAIPALLSARGQQADDPAPLNFSCNLKLAQLKAIYEGAPFALCLVDLKRRYVNANQHFAALIGVDLDQIIGRRVEDVYPRAIPFALADLKAAVNGGPIPPREMVMPESRRVILSTVAAARDENNEVIGMSVALIDITKYKMTAPSSVVTELPRVDGGSLLRT